MPDWARKAISDWALERGLAFEEQGLLAPTNPVLRHGLGEGPHRAGMVTQFTAHSMTSTGGFTKRAERGTENICRGKLPGGEEGVLAHHWYLVDGLRGEHGSWNAFPHTVVVVHLPEAVRAFRDVKSTDAGLAADPATDQELLDRYVAGGPLSEALGYLPDVKVDLHDGWLCLSVSQVWSDAARLDWMCHAAARFAAGVRRAVASLPELDHERPLPPPRDTEQARWIDEGMRAIDWPEPPGSVAAATAAYAEKLRPASRARGRKAGMIALGALVVASILFAAIDGIALLFGVSPAAVVAMAVFEVVVFLPFTVHAALKAGREFGQDDLAFRSRMFGLEAFARGYAASRGMTQEDRDELRHRLPPPRPGAPLRSWHGRLGGPEGPPGRLVMWIDRTEAGPSRYALVAVADGVVLTEPVADTDRSAARLDAIAARARDAVLQNRGVLHDLHG